MGIFLSDKELEQVDPAENAFESPVPTQVISNGEFNPMWLLFGLGAFVAVVLLVFFFTYGALWLKAFLTGVYTGITDIVGMRLDDAIEYAPDARTGEIVKTELKSEILLNGNHVAVLVPGGTGPEGSLAAGG